jgi:16S rRNA (cytosine967-C5)-methyltransferase
VFEHHAYADRAFVSEASELDPRERAFAMQLAYGTVQRRGTLDYVAGRLVARPLSRLEPGVRAAIELGLFQLLCLDGVADHAAVNQSVELTKAISPPAAALVNAVLRRAARSGPELLAGLDDSEPAGAAIVHSVPEWLAELWWNELGAVEARALLAAVNEPAESALRINTLVITIPEALVKLPVPAHAAPGLPEGFVLEAPFDAHGSELWQEGAIMPQSRASMQVTRALAPTAGERVLDLCAAPGGKTTHIAALMADEGEVVAVERHPGRAGALEQTCARMRARSVRVEVGDAAAPRTGPPFDRVLVDPPCSGLGTLQSRPDRRWRASAAAIGELAPLQAQILDAGAGALKPGGTLVYSVCTISRAESSDVIEGFLGTHPEFEPDGPYLQLLPHRDGTDGFFIARLRAR